MRYRPSSYCSSPCLCVYLYCAYVRGWFLSVELHHTFTAAHEPHSKQPAVCLCSINSVHSAHLRTHWPPKYSRTRSVVPVIPLWQRRLQKSFRAYVLISSLRRCSVQSNNTAVPNQHASVFKQKHLAIVSTGGLSAACVCLSVLCRMCCCTASLELPPVRYSLCDLLFRTAAAFASSLRLADCVVVSVWERRGSVTTWRSLTLKGSPPGESTRDVRGHASLS